jgi:hypothetical protein
LSKVVILSLIATEYAAVFTATGGCKPAGPSRAAVPDR